MTEDTKRALKVIEPLAHELGISVTADDNLLYIGNVHMPDVNIGISCNSTWATIWEFIGCMMLEYDNEFRAVHLDEKQKDIIKRYWVKGVKE